MFVSVVLLAEISGRSRKRFFFYGRSAAAAIQTHNYHDRKTTFDMLANETQFPYNITICICTV